MSPFYFLLLSIHSSLLFKPSPGGSYSELPHWAIFTVCSHIFILLNSREKFKPGPGFEPRTSRSLVWLSTTWAILVLDDTGLNLPLESYAIQALWSVTLSVTIWPTSARLDIWRSEVQIAVQVCMFLLNLNCNSSRHKLQVCIHLSICFKQTSLYYSL